MSSPAKEALAKYRELGARAEALPHDSPGRHGALMAQTLYYQTHRHLVDAARQVEIAAAYAEVDAERQARRKEREAEAAERVEASPFVAPVRAKLGVTP